MLEGGSISSKMDGVEGASDLVRCEDVRSCAIDYAIRRDWTDIVVTMMVFEDVEGRIKSMLKNVTQTVGGSMELLAHSRLRCQAPGPLIA